MREIKRYLLFLFFIVMFCQSFAQPLPDSIKNAYTEAENDSEKGRILTTYLLSVFDDTSFLERSGELINYFRSQNDQSARDYVQLVISDYVARTGSYTNTLHESLAILDRFENRKDSYGVLVASRVVSVAYDYAGEVAKSILFLKKVIDMALVSKDYWILCSSYNNIASDFVESNMPDSALHYLQNAVLYAEKIDNAERLATIYGTFGEAYLAKQNYDEAIVYLNKSTSMKALNKMNQTWTMNDFAQIFLEKNKLDSAKWYARAVVELASKKAYLDQLQRAYQYLSQAYEKESATDSAFKYYKLTIATKDSLFNSQKTKQVQAILFQEQTRKQEIEQEKAQLQNRIRTYGLIAGLAIFLIIAFILYRNNKQKQKANIVLEKTLENLKSTQSQLIQAEKMASLGELTAGIAHEIQNPLNFVNNFSEVNKELLEELKSKNEKLKIHDAEIDELVNDISENSEKINHHGKRADSIVKGMLQHSQSGKGQKGLTDINALADEYLRLSYHGLRSKEKSFNATLKTGFDENIGKIKIVPQDIGRVLLNLYNNAFYAVNEKAASFKLQTMSYEPIISVTTKRQSNNITITIEDNGTGIPKNIVDKIFQPFFTTKPTGQGTGLGLSLAYDIVKAHGGEIKVESKEGEGTEFIIQLPL
ncbi:MAG: ATP-binding protein [Chitinophagaceae bacterium]